MIRYALPSVIAGRVGLAIVLWLAALFVVREAMPYLLHFDAVMYGHFWPRRGWLLLHVAAGALALLLGPVQLLANRWRREVVHRWIGRTYLASVFVCALTALKVSVAGLSELAFTIAFETLAMVWMAAAGMALVAIRRGNVQLHKEWLLRSYLLGYTVVTFRWVMQLPWLSGADPEYELTIGWLSWTVPLFILELLLSWRRLTPK